MMKAIEFRGVWEKYRIKYIREKKVSWEQYWALEDISFFLNKGEVLGIIGRNGAGKTTILKLIAGMVAADRGEIEVKGEVSALMELGAGFNPEFTGRENVALNAKAYGLDERMLEEKMAEIVEFSDLGKFIDAPIKCYSQGMYMRLAFALAIFVEPDILLIDDILAVGDEEAQQKCIKKIFELKQSGKTIVVVSHDMNMIARLCSQVILLEGGRSIQSGLPQEVIPRYLEVVGDKRGIAILEAAKLRVVFNNGKVTINYKKAILTKGLGGFVSFFLPAFGHLVSSVNLNWQIKSFLPEEIIAEGTYQDGTISQTWKLRIQQDCLQWQVQKKDDSIKEAHLDLLLVSDYRGWLNFQKEGDFGLFSHKFNWQELELGEYKGSMLALRENSQKYNLPFLVFESEACDGSQFKLFNTGYEQEARVIQRPLAGNKNISVKIKFFSGIDAFKEYIVRAREEFFLEQQKKQAQIYASRTISSNDLRLFADLEAKCLRFYYKEKEFTQSSGLYGLFLIKRAWHDLFSSQWQVKKDNNILILRFFWEEQKVAQLWKLWFEGNKLLWQINYECSPSQRLKIFKFGLFLHPEYKTYFCGYEQSNFPNEFIPWQNMTLGDAKAKFFGLRKRSFFPAIALENKSNLSCIIQNGDAESFCRVLGLGSSGENLIKEKNTFSTEISFLKEETLIEKCLEQGKQKRFISEQKEQVRTYVSRRIASGNLRLFADLEAKSLRLYYKQKEFTQGPGLHCSFLIERSWHDLSSSQWQVKKEGNSLIMHFSWEEQKVNQQWRFLLKDHRLTWIINSECSQPEALKMFKFGLFLHPEYRRFFCGHQQGNFPREFIYWQDMVLGDSKVELFGLRKQGELPAVILENNQNFFCVIQSSDTESSCRALQLSLPDEFLSKRTFFSAVKVGFFEKEDLIEEHIRREGKEIILKRQEEQNHQQALGTISSGDISLFADMAARSLKLYYKDKIITHAGGLYNRFNILSNFNQGGWFHLQNAEWQIQKISETKMILTLNYKSLALSQIWTFSCSQNNILEIEVDIKANKPLFFNNYDVGLEVQDEYENWLTVSEQGKILVKQYIDNIGPIRLKDNRISQVLLLSKNKSDFPELFFLVSSCVDRQIMGIHKHRKTKGESICLNSALIIPKSERLVVPGNKHDYFRGKIILGQNIKPERESNLREVIRLNKDNLKFTFDQGKGKIFWENKELTAGLSVYTSVRCLGMWYDSYQAVWRVDKKKNNKIVVFGDWPYIPVSQKWQIELVDKDLIAWQVDMEIDREINLEIEQTNLMLSSAYRAWTVPALKCKGEFFDEFTEDYDILPFRFWYGKAKKIMAAASTLPKVIFEHKTIGRNLRAVIENTDNLYRARLLQYQKVHSDKSPPGEYLGFRGLIKFEHKE